MTVKRKKADFHTFNCTHLSKLYMTVCVNLTFGHTAAAVSIGLL